MTCRSPQNFKLPEQGSSAISLPLGIAFGNENYHPWTIDTTRFSFYNNPQLVEAVPPEVKIGKMYEIFVRADASRPFVERKYFLS